MLLSEFFFLVFICLQMSSMGSVYKTSKVAIEWRNRFLKPLAYLLPSVGMTVPYWVFSLYSHCAVTVLICV